MGVATNHMFTWIMVDFDLSIIKLLEFTFVMATTSKVTKAEKFHMKLLEVQQLNLLINSPKSQW
jgi:hypothetical protein